MDTNDQETQRVRQQTAEGTSRKTRTHRNNGDRNPDCHCLTTLKIESSIVFHFCFCLVLLRLTHFYTHLITKLE